jgi:hypothetical protein
MPNSKPGGPGCLSLSEISLNRGTPISYQYNLKLATLQHMFFRLNNIHGLKLTKFHKFLEQEMEYDSPTNLAKYLKISELQYQLQLVLQGTIFNNQVTINCCLFCRLTK